jgi:aminoglycoside phosphotransferase (APT) family kinase protein
VNPAGQAAATADALDGDLADRLRRALAAYWSLADSDGLWDAQAASVRPIRGWEALRGTVPEYAGQPAAFIKVFADGASFEREQRGLLAGRAVVDLDHDLIRVPAVLTTVSSARALIIERVDGMVLSTALRRAYPQQLSERYTRTFSSLGAWLARFHALDCPAVEPAALLAPDVRFIQSNLEKAEPRLGHVRAKKARRLLKLLVAHVESEQDRPVRCHGDFQPDNVILSGKWVYVVDFGYSAVGYREQDLVLLRHNLTANSNDLPFSSRLTAPLWSAFLEAYGYPRDAALHQPTWDLFELRYQSFAVSSDPYRDRRSARRTLLRVFRHKRGVHQFRRWVDQCAEVYGA